MLMMNQSQGSLISEAINLELFVNTAKKAAEVALNGKETTIADQNLDESTEGVTL